MYPLVNIQKAIENGPSKYLIYPLKMVIFHSFLYVYQRVYSHTMVYMIICLIVLCVFLYIEALGQKYRKWRI